MGRKRIIPERVYDFIDYEDTVERDNRVYYKAFCFKCGADRGYKRPNKFKSQCVRCQVKYARSKKTKESYEKHSKSMRGKTPWNKGIKIKQEHVLAMVRGWNRVSGKTQKQRHIQRKIRSKLGSLLVSKLKSKNIEKSETMENLLGYSISEFKKHLESQFQPGMTWENHGEWHIDHVVPDSWFNYDSTNHIEFKKSWALDNLQPLWAKDNLAKSNKYEG